MPLYVYDCQDCGHRFEEIVSLDKREAEQHCPRCKGISKRHLAEPFGVTSSIDPKRDTVYTPKEIDNVVGKASDKKWEAYDERWKKRYSDRRTKRWGGKEPKIVELPRESDGTIRPAMHVGNDKQKNLRKEFSEALKVHRAERIKKGISQFDGPGAIAE